MTAVGGAGVGVTVTATEHVAVRLLAPVAVMVYVVLAVGLTVIGPAKPTPATVGEKATLVALALRKLITTGLPGAAEVAGDATQPVRVGAVPVPGPGPAATVTVVVAFTEPAALVAVSV